VGITNLAKLVLEIVNEKKKGGKKFLRLQKPKQLDERDRVRSCALHGVALEEEDPRQEFGWLFLNIRNNASPLQPVWRKAG